MNDIDASNMVDGKPICYWINKKDMVVPADAGFVALVCCTNITARNLNLKNNFQGIFLVYTNYSTVTGSDLINNIFGIRIAASSCNSVTENTVNNTSLVDDSMGIYLDECDNCSISENLACNNFYGVLVNNSKGCTIRENNAHNNVDGFYLNYSRQCVISGNNARDNRAYGIWLTNCSMSTLNENILDSNEHVGIYLETCTYCLLSGNKAKNDNICFEIRYCGNITLRRNDAINSDFGIHFLDSRYCTLRDNTMTGNKYNFGVDDSFILEMLIHDIDVSNKVDDRPIYYLVNEHDKQVPNDAGYVAAVNSTGIRVENVCLMHNVQGALLAFTNYSIVRDTIAFKNSFGIQLRRCHNCTTSESNASKNDYDGIILDNSHYCIINQNDINYNGQFGVHIWDSTHNVFFHSNFINNAWQALITRSSNNSWDNGYPSGGNYWGAYSDTDVYWGLNQDRLGSDGLGDMPYRIYEYATDCDRYPLIVPWTDIPSIGDLNHDGIVNIVDISIVAKAFGAKLGDPNWTDTLDLDKNGMINSLDISMIAICHGKTV
jgi:parallel beta-helix repeat protein